MADVFLSYARQDADRAIVIKEALEELGVSVFFDTEGLDGGEAWPDSLDRELKEAGVVVSVWTKHALSRRWVKIECQMAIERRVLVPLQIEHISTFDKPAALSDIQFYDLEDFQGEADHRDWRRAVRSIAKKLRRPEIDRTRRSKAVEEARAEKLERELQKQREQTERLRKSKGGVRPWQYGAGSAFALALAAVVGWYGVEWQEGRAERAEAARRDRIIPAEMRARLEAIDVKDGASEQRIASIFADDAITLSRLVQASALDADAAVLAGYAYYYGVGDAPESESEAAHLWEIACDADSDVGCNNLGFLYAHGQGVEEDDARAIGYYERACAVDYLISCDNLGFHYDMGFGVEEDDVRANELYLKACEGGQSNGCFNIAVQYATGEGAEEDDAEANLYYRRACDEQHMGSCYNLALQYINGSGVEEDVGEAIALYEYACKGDHGAACVNLGLHYDDGDGVMEDDVRANALYRQACDGGEPSGCFNLGVQYATAEGVKTNYAEAARLYRRGCDGGDAPSCFNLGLAHESGDGVKEDDSAAYALHEQACRMGHKSACSSQGWLMANGWGVPRDVTKGRRLLEIGCEGGNDWGCDRLAELTAGDRQGGSR